MTSYPYEEIHDLLEEIALGGEADPQAWQAEATRLLDLIEEAWEAPAFDDPFDDEEDP